MKFSNFVIEIKEYRNHSENSDVKFKIKICILSFQGISFVQHVYVSFQEWNT